jgi:5-oxoprolinase (ATP-hydrolysing)
MWKIWVDTGGTFTDTIITDPTGVVTRIKLLSSSCLRGKISHQISEKSLAISFNWPVKQDIFKGYSFQVLNTSITNEVDAIDFDQGILYLKKPVKLESESSFEITGNEEPPILAARLATSTPLHQELPPIEMKLGSTKGTNALLENKGAKVALFITKGFKDLLRIGTQQRPDLFALEIKKSKPLFHMVIEVDERLDANGEVKRPLTKQEIDRVVEKLQQENVTSIAIAFMHSYRNPVHEQQLATHLNKAGYPFASVSSALAPSIKIVPRATTSVVNAYLQPIISNYLNGVSQHLSSGQLKVMTSSGGMMNHQHFEAKDSLLSGPAGGVVGAVRFAKLCNTNQLITFDMGGTSTDVSRYDNAFDYQFETQIGDAQLLSPSLAIESIAAGGGSICYFDGHRLQVGPESGGSFPGPACYGAGGDLTITDVNLLLGRAVASNFQIPLLVEAAQDKLDATLKHIESVTDKKPISENTLKGFLQIANEKMANAIRKISVRNGSNPEMYTLLAFGGAGGQHMCAIANQLNISKALVPYEAGLLSAYGIGHAAIERFTVKQVLKPLNDCDQLHQWVEKLKSNSITQLKSENGDDIPAVIQSVHLFLRLKGQDHTIEVNYSVNLEEIQREFALKYEQIYGYQPTNKTIELESIKVLAISPTFEEGESQGLKPIIYAPKADDTIDACFEKWIQTPVFQWENLNAGAKLIGPSILTSQYNTTVVEPGWELILNAHNVAELTRVEIKQEQTNDSEELQLELFTNRFKTIAANMGELLQRTSFSVNIKERLDFSCGLLNAKGELVVNAPHIPVHLGGLGLCVRSVLQVIEMNEGDVVITNHPKHGGSHLPDITLISPVFFERELIGFVSNRAHHAEIGGMRPGSMPPDAKNLAQEGVVIEPTYLLKNGVPNWDHIESVLNNGQYPSRAVHENLADLNAAVASLQQGKMALIQLCEQYTASTVQHYMNRLFQYSDQLVTDAFQALSSNRFNAIETMDDGHVIQVSIDTTNNITFDFLGTSAQHPGNLNATPAIVNSAVIYVLRLLVGKEIPLNEGMMQHIEIKLPYCFLNPYFPDSPTECPAVVGGNTETSQRIVDTLLKALGLMACSQGTMNNLLFGDETFGYYETIGGGTGAGIGFTGVDATHHHMTNTRITDPEIMEFRYPVVLNQFAIRAESGGAGKWKGGNGVVREIEFLKDLQTTVIAQHRKVVPYGLEGGTSGEKGKQFVRTQQGKYIELTGSSAYNAKKGDRITICTPGGGGYGKSDE